MKRTAVQYRIMRASRLVNRTPAELLPICNALATSLHLIERNPHLAWFGESAYPSDWQHRETGYYAMRLSDQHCIYLGPDQDAATLTVAHIRARVEYLKEPPPPFDPRPHVDRYLQLTFKDPK